MSDHTYLFKPGAQITLTAGAAITGGQLVVVSDDNEVSPSSAASSKWVGVAAFDAASGSAVTVLSGGVHVLKAAASVAAGALVIAAASGGVATIGSDTGIGDVVGVALAASDDTAHTVVVKLAR